MSKLSFIPLAAALLLPLLSSCASTSSAGAAGGGNGKLVVLDIGHHINARGAQAPASLNGKKLTELDFWYEYSYYVKKEIEDAGYRCVIVNRGDAPKSERLRQFASRAGVKHLSQPKTSSPRYPSKHFPDRVSAGIISADYAVTHKAACAVFLHHNSAGGSWSTRATPALFIYNKNNGRQLAENVAAEVIKDLPNYSSVSLQTRYEDASRAAGWMNVCDDGGIPAVVIESAYLNNKPQAQMLTDHERAVDYAEAVGEGIVDYMNRSDKAAPRRRADPNVRDKGSFGYAAESRKLNVPGARRFWH